jgi:2'-5' RNA ligase
MRLFVAVRPPPDVVAALASLPRPERPGLRWTPPEQWHVTLRFFGAVDAGQVEAAVRGVAEAAAAQPPAVARLGPEVGRFGRRVLQVPVSGLDSLAGAVVARTAEVGRPPDARPFAGHLTLARNRGRASLADLTGAAVAGWWRVDEVAVMASVAQGPGMANRYQVVAAFPLEGA